MTMAAQLALALVRTYQLVLSPILVGSCRFEPTCSDYMADAIRQRGACHGIWLGLRRIGRCHPLGPVGYDPVPPADPPALSGSPGSTGAVP
jgi:putative membrane protein insertion efficiency factor